MVKRINQRLPQTIAYNRNLHVTATAVAALGATIGMLITGMFWQPLIAATTKITLIPRNKQQEQARQLVIQSAELMKNNKPFRARPLLEQAVSLWNQSPYIHFTLGVCYSEIGQFNKGIDQYEKALQIDPHLTDCLTNIASCYQLMGQPQQAIIWFKNYLRQNPRAADSGQIRGMIAALQKQVEHQIVSDPGSSDYLASITSGDAIQRWQRNRLPIKLFIANGRDEQGNPIPSFREYYNVMLLDALDTWVKASNNRLAYILVDDASQADIVCSWTDRKDFLREQGNSVEQGIAQVASRSIPDTNENEIVQVRVIILTLDADGQKNISDEDMKKTCLHELGHALGLAGHSPNNRDVMFFSDSPAVWAALTKRDKATIARLYGDYPPLLPAAATTSAPGAPTNLVAPNTTPYSNY